MSHPQCVITFCPYELLYHVSETRELMSRYNLQGLRLIAKSEEITNAEDFRQYPHETCKVLVSSGS